MSRNRISRPKRGLVRVTDVLLLVLKGGSSMVLVRSGNALLMEVAVERRMKSAMEWRIENAIWDN